MKIENTYGYNPVNNTDAVSSASKGADAKSAEKAAEKEKKNVDTMDFKNSAKGTKEATGIYNRSTVSIKNESMKEMVQKLIGGQIASEGQSSFTTQINDLLKEKFGIEPVTHNDADDKDYWNAENTANRLLDFAKTLAGDNEEAFIKLKDQFEKAFGECEKIWGGELPGVCYDTKELVLKGFDDIYNEMKAKKSEPAVEDTEEAPAAAE